MLQHPHYFSRDRRVSVGNVTAIKPRRVCHALVTGNEHVTAHGVAARARRGLKASIKTAWRRTSTGSNHISAHGVWRDHARRALARINRTGETRWHRVPAVARAVHFLARGSSK
jgi:hypothetical protein